MRLTDKQERFCQAYLLEPSGTKAAIVAGYAEASAHVTAARLLKNAKVFARIDQLQSERSERTGIDADYVLRRLVAELEADLADILTPSGAVKPTHEWPLVWRQGLVAGVDVQSIISMGAADESVPAEIVKVKLSDRVQRLKLLGDHVNVQAFKQSVEVKHTENLEDRLEKAMAKRAEYAKSLSDKNLH